MKYFYLILILSLISCNNKVQVPEDIMSKDQMIEFLFDVNLINSSRGFVSKSNNNYFMVRDTMLFRKHAIDCLKFVKSNVFYTKNPKLYIEIYDGIDKKIKFIKDSLNNVKTVSYTHLTLPTKA